MGRSRDTEEAAERGGDLKGGDRSPDHALTIDVQEYFQARAFRDLLVPAEWKSLPSRAERSVGRLLGLLEERNTSATFFFDPWVADRQPQLVRTVGEAGHEIGLLVGERRPTADLALGTDLAEVIPLLEQASNDEVLGHRSQDTRSLAQLEENAEALVDRGFRYDSSVCPVRCRRGKERARARRPFRLEVEGGSLVELPLAAVETLGVPVPVARGLSLRAAPFRMTRIALDRLRSQDRTGVVRVRSWEVDPHQPRIYTGLWSRIRQYTRLGQTFTVLDRLLAHFDFGTAGQVADTFETDADRATDEGDDREEPFAKRVG